MFGKRSNDGSGKPPQAPAPKPMVHAEPEPAPAPALSPEAAMPSMPAAPQAPAPQAAAPQPAPQPAAPRREEPPVKRKSARNEAYYDTKSQVFSALIDTIDLSQLAKLDAESAREEIRDIVNDIITIKNFALSIAEQEELLDDICNDVLGYGPLEPLLARDDIADIMVNGAGMTYIEVAGKVLETDVRFRDNSQLLSICQRIVSQVGRRVDESSPICDARLPDGSRVNVIAPPLAIDGTALTIRKFKKDKLTLDQLVKFGAITPEGAAVLQIIGRVRCNVVISGGTGSGKTTLLNCLTAYIDEDERIITCEDSAELQLQQPHVVRLETRPPNIEGEGEITMRDLVKNCLRMRPERIIVGEVRGPEVFDLLQAMNTGHDGSMGTIHANSPRECLSRMESMIAMGGFTLPAKTVREIIAGSVDVVIQATRLRDGSRRITHITEVVGMEGDVIITPGPDEIRNAGRRRQWQDHRPASLDRHRPSELLGSRPLLWRRQAAGSRARRHGKNDLVRRRSRVWSGYSGSRHHRPGRAFGGSAGLRRALFPYRGRTQGGIPGQAGQGGRDRSLQGDCCARPPERGQQEAQILQDSLKTLEEKNKENDRRKSPALKDRIAQAGLTISIQQFYVFSALLGFVTGFLAFIFQGQPLCCPWGDDHFCRWSPALAGGISAQSPHEGISGRISEFSRCHGPLDQVRPAAQ
jgi:pilus assembly protein CpaF